MYVYSVKTSTTWKQLRSRLTWIRCGITYSLNVRPVTGSSHSTTEWTARYASQQPTVASTVWTRPFSGPRIDIKTKSHLTSYNHLSGDDTHFLDRTEHHPATCTIFKLRHTALLRTIGLFAKIFKHTIHYILALPQLSLQINYTRL